MKTLTISLEDTIYERLLTAGVRNYQETITNPDYDPNIEGSETTKPNEKSRDDLLMVVIEQTVKQILMSYEVNDVSTKAVLKKQKEIGELVINAIVKTTVS